MIALTEIFSKALGYDPTIETVRSSYSLRNIFINPDYVVSFKESQELCEKSKRGSLIDGLGKDVGFTQITFSSTGYAPTKIDVVGTLEQIAEKFQGFEV